MVAVLQLLAVSLCLACEETSNVAAEPAEQAKAKVAIYWVELSPIKGVTVDRSAHGGETNNDYYPHLKPALILSPADVQEVQLRHLDWQMNSGVVRHYSVTLVLTEAALDRLARSCPGKHTQVTIAVDGKYWGWDYYSTEPVPEKPGHWWAKNYRPSMGLMSRANAEQIVRSLKRDP